MKYYNLIFAVFICHVWPLQLLINNPVLYYNICGFSAEQWFEYNTSEKLKSGVDFRYRRCLEGEHGLFSVSFAERVCKQTQCEAGMCSQVLLFVIRVARWPSGWGVGFYLCLNVTEQTQVRIPLRPSLDYKAQSIVKGAYPAFIPRSRVVHWVPGWAEHHGSAWACEFFGCAFNNTANPQTLWK